MMAKYEFVWLVKSVFERLMAMKELEGSSFFKKSGNL